VGRGDATGEGPTYNRNTQVGNSSPNLLANQTVRLDREEPFLRIQTVVVFVRDQTRSLQFYLDQLGFSVAFDARSVPGGGWIGVAPPDGTTVLVLIAPEPDSEEYKLIGRPRHVGFITEDIQAKYEIWSRRGVRFQHPPRIPPWGGIFTTFEDIDGNGFGLVEFDAITRQIEGARRTAAEKLESERRAGQELEIAKQVQARLFPQKRPALRTLEYAGRCI
jgi:catechol 2,3-dioxygenase-like lactoylglutathione lyase family enzyme